MEIYDTEEEQVEALKRWWKANGTSTIAGVVTALLLIGGWNFWQSYQLDKANQASSLYQQLVISESEEKQASVEKISQRLSEQYASTPYADYAALMLAKHNVEQDEVDGAKTILQQLIQTAGDEIKHVARIRLIRLLLASADYEKGLQLIAQVDAATATGFSASYDELKGDLYVALDRLGEARTAYQSALRAGQRSPLLQFKLDDITAADIIEPPVE